MSDPIEDWDHGQLVRELRRVREHICSSHAEVPCRQQARHADDRNDPVPMLTCLMEAFHERTRQRNRALDNCAALEGQLSAMQQRAAAALRADPLDAASAESAGEAVTTTLTPERIAELRADRGVKLFWDAEPRLLLTISTDERDALLDAYEEQKRLRSQLAAVQQLERLNEAGYERMNAALRAQLASVRERTIEECAQACKPMLRSMASRSDLALAIRALATKKEQT